VNATASGFVSKRGQRLGKAATASCQYSSSSSGKMLRSMLCLEVNILARRRERTGRQAAVLEDLQGY